MKVKHLNASFQGCELPGSLSIPELRRHQTERASGLMADCEPLFIFTADIDWAPEHCIEDLIQLFASHGIVPTLFCTHRSAVITMASASGSVELGIHPNFLPGSTHGTTPAEVVDHILQLVPDPVASRSHSYVDGSHVMTVLQQRGVRFDSNLCLFLQPQIVPLRHWTGVWRVPVFWEDDVHWETGQTSWRFLDYKEAFFTPGLKIIDVHPFLQAVNADSAAHYRSCKADPRLADRNRIRELRCAGPGCNTFLREMLEQLARDSARIGTLSQFCASLAGAPVSSGPKRNPE